jgi:hypothetical protein
MSLRRASAAFALAGCAGVAGLEELRFDTSPVTRGDGGSTLPVLPSSEAGAPDVPAAPPSACPAAGRRCAPKPPAGWVGPLVVQQNASVAICPATNANRVLDAFAGSPSGTHSCGGCSCATPTGQTCAQKLVTWTGSSCTGTSSETAISSTCTDVYAPASFSTTATPSGGACAPSGGSASLGPASYSEAIRGCIAPSFLEEGCAQGEVCAADPPAGFFPTHCVASAADLSCPSPYTVRTLAHAGIVDDRGCSACTCAAPTGVSCQGYFTFRSGSGCSASTFAPLSLGSCLGGSGSGSLKVEGNSANGGACAPSGSSPTGSVGPKDPVTICCLP